MKNTLKIFTELMVAAIMVSVFILSCTNDHEPEARQVEITEENPVVLEDSCGINGISTPCNVICDLGLIILETDTLLFSDHPGTICCVTGPEEAAPGDTLTFLYNTNLNDSALTVVWEARKGSLQLLGGQGMPVATFLCRDDFNGGTIRGLGISQNVYDDIAYELKCSSGSDIIKK